MRQFAAAGWPIKLVVDDVGASDDKSNVMPAILSDKCLDVAGPLTMAIAFVAPSP